MREFDIDLLSNTIESMILDVATNIPSDVLSSLKEGLKIEESPLGKDVLNRIIENDELAKFKNLPMCQDTGIVIVFLEIGFDVHFSGDIYDAINIGVHNAYINGFLRKSVVKHPLDRINTKDNTPAIVHIKLVPGDKVKIDLSIKGAGSENVSLVKMLSPLDGIDGIKKLVLNTINDAGGKPCPPIIVGLGIGGDLEKSALLAKEALLRDIDDENDDPILNKLEKELKEDINNLGIGPMGFGGRLTCLAVKIKSYPCHIASLPVAINIQCHASRHKTKVI